MRILFWVPYPSEGASNRYRVEQYLPYLDREGIAYTVHPFWRSSAFKVLYKRGFYVTKLCFFIVGTVARLIDVLNLRNYDVVFIHRESCPVGGVFFETILKLLRKPFIFDFDDAIFLPASSRSNSFIERFKKPGRVAKIIKMSKHTIAGNRYLADFAAQHNQRVSVIPTPIDTERYTSNGQEKPQDRVTIGWVGSVTTAKFLTMMHNVFTELTRRYEHLAFTMVGVDRIEPPVPHAIVKSWSLEGELEDLRTFDIGIMPMPDNEWTRGKCAFKALLYMSMGIPCVASPVGVNREVIADGVNGFFAGNDEEWYDRLSRLIDNPRMRRDVGKNGAKSVEDKYSLKVNAPKFLGIIQKVYDESC